MLNKFYNTDKISLAKHCFHVIGGGRQKSSGISLLSWTDVERFITSGAITSSHPTNKNTNNFSTQANLK